MGLREDFVAMQAAGEPLTRAAARLAADAANQAFYGDDGAKARQVGGSHYKDCAIQPIEFILKNGLGFCEGNVVKYVTRWRAKGGIADLEKARHYIDLLIEHETPDGR